MASYSTSSQPASQGWLMDSSDRVENRRSSSPLPLLADKPHRLSEVYKANANMSSYDAPNQLHNIIKTSLMNAIEPALHWPTAYGLSQHDQRNYLHSPAELYSPPEQYSPSSAETMDSPYEPSNLDRTPYVYQYPQDLSCVDLAASCPRIHPDELDLSSFTVGEPDSEAYPPTSYLMDPHKHELYMNFARRQMIEDCSFGGREHEALEHLQVEHRCDPESAYVPIPTSAPPTTHTSSPNTLIKSESSSSEGSQRSESEALGADETDPEGNEPYAKLIYRALLGAPGHRMVLKEIYEWFIDHTGKNKNPSQKGWQNSIRHNLSMNGAFRKVEHDSSSTDAKKGYVWVLEPSAIADGVKSTTRYRKTGPNKKHAKSEVSTSKRQVSGRKGGQAARRAKSAKSKKRVKAAICDEDLCNASVSAAEPSTDTTNPCGSLYQREKPTYGDTATGPSAHHPSQALMPDGLPDDAPLYAYYPNPSAQLSQDLNMDQNSHPFGIIAGIVEGFPDEPLFYDSPGMVDECGTTDLHLDYPGPASF